MELKTIFQMTKTDRYTQDGRDELAKLQETEDVTYKTGDISQKTGLQKQPDGSWAPPKKGGSGAKKAAESKKIDYQVTEKGGKFYATGHQFSDGSQLHAGPFGSEKDLHEFMNGSPYKSTAESKPAAQEALNKQKADRNAKLYEDGIKALVQHAQNTRENWTEEELQKEYDLDKTDAKAVKENLDRLANPQKTDNSDLYDLSDITENKSEDYKKGYNAIQEDFFKNKLKNGDITLESLKEVHKQGVENGDETKEYADGVIGAAEEYIRSQIVEAAAKKHGFTEEGKKNFKDMLDRVESEGLSKMYEDLKKQGYADDSAPRELTGDCRIRIRKEKPKLTGDTKIRVKK
jgi:hypothetical protein